MTVIKRTLMRTQIQVSLVSVLHSGLMGRLDLFFNYCDKSDNTRQVGIKPNKIE